MCTPVLHVLASGEDYILVERSGFALSVSGISEWISGPSVKRVNRKKSPMTRRKLKKLGQQKRCLEATCSITDFATCALLFCMICDFLSSYLLVHTLFSQLISGSGLVYRLYVLPIGKEMGRPVYVKQTINS